MSDHEFASAVLSRLIRSANAGRLGPSALAAKAGAAGSREVAAKLSGNVSGEGSLAGARRVDPVGAWEGPQRTAAVPRERRRAAAEASEPISEPVSLRGEEDASGTGLPVQLSTRSALVHDASNLLSALNLYSGLLASPNVLTERHRHYAEDLKLVAERSWGLIERLFAYERSEEAARTPGSAACPPPCLTSMVDVLTECGGLLSTFAEGKLEVTYGPQAALPVPIAPETLERILVNLVKNAVDATREKGAIRIRVGLGSQTASEVQGLAAGSVGDGAGSTGMVLSVDDSGCGISEERLQKLMSGAPAGPGRQRGLGLHVVRDLVAASGGVLTVQSRPGVGTRIEMRWPVADRVAALGEEAWAGDAAGPVRGVIERMEMVAESPGGGRSPGLEREGRRDRDGAGWAVDLAGGLSEAERMLLTRRTGRQDRQPEGDVYARGYVPRSTRTLRANERLEGESGAQASAAGRRDGALGASGVSGEGAIAC